MINTLKITVHSFVDLITNSSTEIYIQATQKTIESITKLVDNILTVAGSTFKCEDLFDITIDKESFYKNYYQGEEEGEPKKTVEEFFDMELEADAYRNIHITVKAKINTLAAKQAAETLSSLTSLFCMEARYNG